MTSQEKVDMIIRLFDGVPQAALNPMDEGFIADYLCVMDNEDSIWVCRTSTVNDITSLIRSTGSRSEHDITSVYEVYDVGSTIGYIAITYNSRCRGFYRCTQVYRKEFGLNFALWYTDEDDYTHRMIEKSIRDFAPCAGNCTKDVNKYTANYNDVIIVYKHYASLNKPNKLIVSLNDKYKLKFVSPTVEDVDNILKQIKSGFLCAK